jgi:branched-chain amino acid transport system ATP-binding protein
MTSRPVVLAVEDLRAGFGSTTVLHGVDLEVHEGECAAILGLNGAGKSVTMKVLAGIVPAWAGRIILNEEPISRLEAEARVGRGLSFMTQGRQVFPALTVEENIRLGAYLLRKRNRAEYPKRLAEIFERFPRLAERREQLAGTMSGGEQAILALARALIAGPKVLLIDEPTAGLAPVIIETFLETLQQLNAEGLTMLLVEQNVPFALRLAQRAHIMQRGTIVYASDVATIDRDAMVAHLGIGRLLAPTVDAAGASTNGTKTRKRVTARKAPS